MQTVAKEGEAAGAQPRQTSLNLWACGGLSLCWCLVALSIGVDGEFPISDDWAYAFGTERFLETGRVERLDWTFVPMLPNAWIGGAFSHLFGFSFETLRLSNLFMGWVGMLGSYALIRECRGSIGSATFGAVLFGFNPLHLLLAFTFMSDVTFVALMVWSSVWLVRGLSRGQWTPLAVGVGIGILACLSRQFAVVLFPALVVALTWGSFPRLEEKGQERFRLFGVAALLLGVLALLGLTLIPFGPDDAGSLAGVERYVSWLLEEPNLSFFVLRNGLWFAVYLGLLLLPVALFAGVMPGPRGTLLSAAGAAVILAAVTLATPLRMPFTLDLVNSTHLGWNTLAGLDQVPLPSPLGWGLIAWLGLTAALALAPPLAKAVVAGLTTARDRPERLFLLALSAGYLVLLLPRWPCFDRYLVPAVPVLAALLLTIRDPSVGASREVFVRRLGVVALGLLAIIGFAAARDNMTHHRARWSLLDPLLEGDVRPGCVDGGLELAGWKSYDSLRQDVLRQFVGDPWQLTMGAAREGYVELDRRDYWRALPPRRETIRLLERNHIPERCRREAEAGPAS